MKKENIVFLEVEKIAAYVFELLLTKRSTTTKDKFLTVALSGVSTPRQMFKYITTLDKG